MLCWQGGKEHTESVIFMVRVSSVVVYSKFKFSIEIFFERPQEGEKHSACELFTLLKSILCKSCKVNRLFVMQVEGKQ